MKTDNKPHTFVASVRVDLRDIASIAILMRSQGEFVGTAGKIASEGIRILGDLSQKKYPVATQTEAVTILRQLGYEDTMTKGTKYYNALHRELGAENDQYQIQTEQMDIIKEHMRTMKHSQMYQPPQEAAGISAPADVSKAEDILPQASASTLVPAATTVMSDKEAKDVARLRTAMKQFGDAPMTDDDNEPPDRGESTNER